MKDKSLSYKTNANLKWKKNHALEISLKKSFASYLWTELDVQYCELLYVDGFFYGF